MFLILLLISRAASEWVEIAQTHYRKEPPRRVSVGYKETTEANRIYPNFSIEQQWHRTVTRFPNVGNVMRVQYPGKTGMPIQISPEDDLTSVHSDEYKIFGVRAPYIKSTDVSQTQIFQTQKTTVQDEMRLLFEEIKNKNSRNNLSLRPNFSSATEKNYNETNTFKASKLKSKSDNKFIENQAIYEHDHDLIPTENNFKGNPNMKRVQIEPTISEGKRKHSSKQPDNGYKMDVPEIVSNLTKDKSRDSETLLKVENLQLPSGISNKKTKDENLPNSVHSNSHTDGNAKYSYKNKINHGTVLNETVVTDHKNIEVDKERKNEDMMHETKQNDQEAVRNANEDLAKKTNAVEVIWKFMKVITDNISRNTRRSVSSKMRYLEDLRNSILANIEDRIDQAWPDDNAGPSRRRRSARGHVEFPSSESALMTISFLTFAVFLIKLVLQVIHTYKSKTMMVTPAVVAAVGRAAAALKDRKHN